MNKALEAFEDLYNYLFNLPGFEEGGYPRKAIIEYGIDIETELKRLKELEHKAERWEYLFGLMKIKYEKAKDKNFKLDKALEIIIENYGAYILKKAYKQIYAGDYCLLKEVFEAYEK